MRPEVFQALMNLGAPRPWTQDEWEVLLRQRLTVQEYQRWQQQEHDRQERAETDPYQW